MKALNASILALGLLAGTGTASAQSQGYGPVYGATDGAYGGQAGYGQDQDGAYYDYARVVRVDPVFVQGSGYPAANGQRCYREQSGYVDRNGVYRDGGYAGNGYGSYGNAGYGNGGYGNTGYGAGGYGSTAGANVATVIGGVLGAAVGSQVGGGSARYATAAIGSMVGGMAGRQVYERSHAPVRTASVEVCDPVSGYRDDARDGYDDGRAGAYDVTYEYAGRTHTTRTRYNPGNRIRVRVDVSAD